MATVTVVKIGQTSSGWRPIKSTVVTPKASSQSSPPGISKACPETRKARVAAAIAAASAAAKRRAAAVAGEAGEADGADEADEAEVEVEAEALPTPASTSRASKVPEEASPVVRKPPTNSLIALAKRRRAIETVPEESAAQEKQDDNRDTDHVRGSVSISSATRESIQLQKTGTANAAATAVRAQSSTSAVERGCAAPLKRKSGGLLALAAKRQSVQDAEAGVEDNNARPALVPPRQERSASAPHVSKGGWGPSKGKAFSLKGGGKGATKAGKGGAFVRTDPRGAKGKSKMSTTSKGKGGCSGSGTSGLLDTSISYSGVVKGIEEDSDNLLIDCVPVGRVMGCPVTLLEEDNPGAVKVGSIVLFKVKLRRDDTPIAIEVVINGFDDEAAEKYG